MLKVFLSYAKPDQKIAGQLKKYFEEWQLIQCFVAHDDIIPGSQWEQEILKELQSSDFFMPLQTENLKNSFWCQQEAGFALALAHKIKIVPLIPDEDGIEPVGFYAKYQGFKIKIANLRKSVKEWLKKEGVIDAKDSEELEKRMIIFESSDSFYQAGENIRSLLKLENQLTVVDIQRIAEATFKNSQILHSWDAQSYLKPFFIKHADLISKENLAELLRAG